MTPKSKFKPGDIVYYKYPSRYSRARDPRTVEAIIKIHGYLSPFYNAEIIKHIRGNLIGDLNLDHDWDGMIQLDTVALDTYSRHLTPAEKVLYG